MLCIISFYIVKIGILLVKNGPEWSLKSTVFIYEIQYHSSTPLQDPFLGINTKSAQKGATDNNYHVFYTHPESPRFVFVFDIV